MSIETRHDFLDPMGPLGIRCIFNSLEGTGAYGEGSEDL